MNKMLRNFQTRIVQSLPYHFHFSKIKEKIRDDWAIFSFMALKCMLDNIDSHDQTKTIREKIH